MHDVGDHQVCGSPRLAEDIGQSPFNRRAPERPATAQFASRQIARHQIGDDGLRPIRRRSIQIDTRRTGQIVACERTQRLQVVGIRTDLAAEQTRWRQGQVPGDLCAAVAA